MFGTHLNTLWLLVAMQIACNYESLAISPDIQTAVFKGVPDNWATNIDIDPFVKIGQKYYFIVTGPPVNWFTAVNECARRNAHLAAIENAQEMDALEKYLRSKDIYSWLWVSGHDLADNGSFHWSATGQPVSYIRWGLGNPKSRAPDEHCMYLLFEEDKFVINVRSCMHTTPYICEARTPRTVAFTIW